MGAEKGTGYFSLAGRATGDRDRLLHVTILKIFEVLDLAGARVKSGVD
jgi:hypothetical protein